MNDEAAIGDGAFVGRTQYWFVTREANNFLVAIIFQIFFEVQAMLVE